MAKTGFSIVARYWFSPVPVHCLAKMQEATTEKSAFQPASRSLIYDLNLITEKKYFVPSLSSKSLEVFKCLVGL